MKAKTDQHDEDENFHDCIEREEPQKPLSQKEKIVLLLEEGNSLYEATDYKAALEKFEQARELDTKKAFIHHCDFHTGLIYNKLAEDTEDMAQKKSFYKMVADYFISVTKNYTNYLNDVKFIDINSKIAIALDNAGDKQRGTKYYEKTELFKRFGKTTQELGVNPNELVVHNQDIYNHAFHPNCSTDNKIVFLAQAVYELKLNQQCIIQEINKINEKLRVVGIDNEFNIKSKINYLKANNSELYKYYVYFNEGLQNIYLAAKALASGLLVPNVGHMSA